VFLLMAAALYGPVCYAGIAHPGNSYSMSDSYWVNSGTEPETIVIHVDPPAGSYWIRMKENSIILNPGQAASIPVTLYIPPGAAKGIYEAKLVASSGAEENVLFGVGVKADCTGGSPAVRKKGNSGGIIPLGIVGGLLITVLIGLRIMPRRSTCDHPVHGPRRSKWQSLTPRDALLAQARSRLRPPPAARPMRVARVRPYPKASFSCARLPCSREPSFYEAATSHDDRRKEQAHQLFNDALAERVERDKRIRRRWKERRKELILRRWTA